MPDTAQPETLPDAASFSVCPCCGRPLDAGLAGPVYLTIEKAARMLCVSKGTIRSRLRTGALPAKRLRDGQTVLIDQQDVLALLEDARPHLLGDAPEQASDGTRNGRA